MRPWIVCVNEAVTDPEFWAAVLVRGSMIGCPEAGRRIVEDLVSVKCSQEEARQALQWFAIHFASTYKHSLIARKLEEGEECPHCSDGHIEADPGPGPVFSLTSRPDTICGDCQGTGVNQRDVVDNNQPTLGDRVAKAFSDLGALVKRHQP